MMTMRARLEKAFTLVEILIIISLLAMLALISIPNFVRSRVQANEAVTKMHLRLFTTALASYRTTQAQPSYPENLTILSSGNPAYIDTVITSGARTGYQFTYTRVDNNQFTIVATPQITNITGTNTYFVDESGVIRFDNASGNAIG